MIATVCLVKTPKTREGLEFYMAFTDRIARSVSGSAGSIVRTILSSRITSRIILISSDQNGGDSPISSCAPRV